MWAKEEEIVVWVLCAFWDFKKIIGLFLSLHNIIEVQEEKCRSESSFSWPVETIGSEMIGPTLAQE